MTQVALYSSADAQVQSNAGTTNYGTTAWMNSGENNVGNETWRSFVQFNLSSVPQGSRIVSATLNLVIRVDRSSNTRTKRFYQVTSSWDEGTITWNNQPGYSTELGSLSMGTGDSGTVAWSIDTSVIQSMVNGSTSNYGFVLVTDTPNDDDYEFYTRDDATESNRPQLVINYIPPGAFLFNMI